MAGKTLVIGLELGDGRLLYQWANEGHLPALAARRDRGEQFASLPIVTAPDGTIVRLGDVAQITDGFDEDAEEFASWDGHSAVMIDVFRVGDQKVLDLVLSSNRDVNIAEKPIGVLRRC